jgi:hypothetical protein
MLIIVEHDPNDDWWQDLDPYGEEGPEWDPRPREDEDDDADWYMSPESDPDQDQELERWFETEGEPDDITAWIEEDGGLTAEAYEWLAEQDSQQNFC